MEINRARSPRPEASIVEDYTCHRCGYILRGLREDGVCPECGEAVAASLDPNRLVRVEPSVLQRVEWGLLGLIAAPLLAMLGWWIGARLNVEGVWLALIATLTAWLLGSVGLVTVSPQPLDLPRSAETSRRWARRLALLTGIAVAVTALTPDVAVIPKALARVASMTLGTSLAWMTLSYAAFLARGVDRPDLAHNFEGTMPWMVILAIGVYFASVAMIVFATLRQIKGPSSGDAECLVIAIAFVPVAIGSIAGAALVIAAWVLLIRLAWALHRVGEQATLLHGK